MKTNHKLKVKLISLGLMVLMVGIFTQCVATNTDQVGGSNSNSPYTPGGLDNDQDPGQIINSTLVSEGMKSHEQILHTMATLTGVNPMNGAIVTVYNQVATTLPTDNDIKVFLPPHQLAITKLAAEFCKIMVDSATLRDAIWPGYNFNAVPTVAFDFTNRDFLIQNILNAFWGEDIVSDIERDAAIVDLNLLITDLNAGEAQNNSTTTRNVVKGVCTAVLSSAHVTLL
jgi:hypothetical protein